MVAVQADIETTQATLREHLLAEIEARRDVLAADLDGEEAQGHLHEQTVGALYDSGVLHMKAPRELGGGEADLVTQFEVLEAVATINPAAAWCSMVGATSLGLPGAFLPDEGISEMFADQRLPRGAIVIMPTAKAVPEGDGFRVTGRWAFASGVHHAEWIAANVLVETAKDAAPVLHMMCFPASDMTLHDTWQVVGLRATGSTDISVSDLFIPGHRAWNVAEQPPRRGGPLYRLGIPAFVANEHAAVAIGIARRALDSLVDTAITKRRGYGPGAKTLADRAPVQRLIGRGEIELNAARALALDLNREAMTVVNGGGDIDNELALRVRAVACYCTEVASETVTAAFRATGASAIFDTHDMQRCLRDINVAAQHLMVSEQSYELLGQVRLGVADVQPMG